MFFAWPLKKIINFFILLTITFILTAVQQNQKDQPSTSSAAQRDSIQSLVKTADDYFQKQNYEQALKYLESALRLSEPTTDSLLKAEILLKLCETNQNLTRNNEALQNVRLAFTYLQATTNNALLARAYRLMGRSYWYFGKYQPSLNYYLKAKQLYVYLNDSLALSAIYNTIGTIQWFLGNYDIALENYKTALKLSKRVGDLEREAKVLNNIGLIYQNLGRWKEAMHYHNLALEVARKTKVGFGYIYSQINLGQIAIAQNEYDKAFRLFKEAETYFKEQNDLAGLSYIYKFLGDASQQMNEPQKALEYYSTSLELGKKVQNNYRICEALFNIGRVHLMLDRIQQAEANVLQSLAIAQQEGYKNLMSNAYQMLADINLKKANFTQAYHFLNKAMQFKDSLLSEQKLAAISDLQLQFDLEQQETENLLLRNRNMINELKLRNEKLLRYSLLSIILLIAIMFGLIFQKWRVSKKLNEKLTTQNENIRRINAEKEELISELKEALENINTLENLLPICSSCKKIRDDEGYWQSVEDYISSHSQIKFSHGLCPECTARLYPDIYKRVEQKKKDKK